MKKLVCILCVLVMGFSCTIAWAEVDLTRMTTKELQALIDAAKDELEKRNNAEQTVSETVIVDQNGIYLAFAETETHPNLYSITQHFVLKNQSAYPLTIAVKKAEVNGWGITRAYVQVGNSGYKSKTFEAGENYRDLGFDINDLPGDAGIKKASDIKSVVLVISLEQQVTKSTKRTMNVEINCTYTNSGNLKVTSIKQTN